MKFLCCANAIKAASVSGHTALAGIELHILLIEVIDAMYQVGSSLPPPFSS